MRQKKRKNASPRLQGGSDQQVAAAGRPEHAQPLDGQPGQLAYLDPGLGVGLDVEDGRAGSAASMTRLCAWPGSGSRQFGQAVLGYGKRLNQSSDRAPPATTTAWRGRAGGGDRRLRAAGHVVLGDLHVGRRDRPERHLERLLARAGT
jgi:hypothetical protein